MLSALRGRATDVASVTVPPSGAIRQTAGQASGTPAARHGGEAVGLSPRPGEGQREQGPDVLAQWLLVRGRGEGRRHFGGSAHREPDPSSVDLGGRPQLGEPGPLGVGVRGAGELGIRQAPPQRQRRGQLLVDRLQVCGRHAGCDGEGVATEQAVSLRDPAGEHDLVDGVRRDVQQVTGSPGHQQRAAGAWGPSGFEDPPQRGDVTVQRGLDGGRRSVAPEQVGQRLDGDDPAGVQYETGEQRPLLVRPEVEVRAVPHGLHRTEDGDPHPPSVGRR